MSVSVSVSESGSLLIFQPSEYSSHTDSLSASLAHQGVRLLQTCGGDFVILRKFGVNTFGIGGHF